MNKAIAQLIFTILLFFFFIYTALEAREFAQTAKYFPLYLSITATVILFIEIIRQIVRFQKNKETDEVLHPHMRAVIVYTILIVLYAVLVYVIGLLLASAIYVFVFLYFIANMRLIGSIITVAILIAFLVIFGDVMNLYWPKSLFNILDI